MITFNSLFHAAWNLRRFRRLEAALMVNGLDPLVDESAAKTLDRLQRYAAAADRAASAAVPTLTAWTVKEALGKDLFVMNRNPYFYGVDSAGNQLPYFDQVTHRQEVKTSHAISGQ